MRSVLRLLFVLERLVDVCVRGYKSFARRGRARDEEGPREDDPLIAGPESVSV